MIIKNKLPIQSNESNETLMKSNLEIHQDYSKSNSNANHNNNDSNSNLKWTLFPIIKGTRDYKEVKGDTGPLVYPAAHVYSLWILYLIAGGPNQRAFQWLFAIIHLITLYMVIKIYKRARVKNLWPFILLCFGRRIHSIYVLRMFNDCIAMMFLYGSIFCLLPSIMPLSNTNSSNHSENEKKNDNEKKMKNTLKITNIKHDNWWTFGIILYAIGLGIKMNILLWLPAIALTVYSKTRSIVIILSTLSLISLIQLILGYPFWQANWHSYWTRSFQFSRKFMYQWSVNWQFLSESIFNSSITHGIFIIIHVMLLSMTIKRYLKIIEFNRKRGNIKKNDENGNKNDMNNFNQSSHPIVSIPLLAPQDIVGLFAECGVIGMLCSRSLHYQFYTWYFHMIPFILYGYKEIHVIWKLLIFLMLELSWSIYPANSFGSIILFLNNIGLLIMCHYRKNNI